jgi:hypothetical protein
LEVTGYSQEAQAVEISKGVFSYTRDFVGVQKAETGRDDSVVKLTNVVILTEVVKIPGLGKLQTEGPLFYFRTKLCKIDLKMLESIRFQILTRKLTPSILGRRQMQFLKFYCCLDL